MKIAIHHRIGSFSDKWIEYSEVHALDYKLVNCYDSDIIADLKDCEGLLWHWQQYDYKAVNFARQLTYSLEQAGKTVFPNRKTCWHFDDKVGQKYLLEALNTPLVKSFVFYDKDEALQWARNTNYPKVFKLRGGAGSMNVMLVHGKKKAFSLIRKAFGKGFSPSNNKEKVKDRWGKLKRNRNKTAFLAVIRGIALYLIPGLDPNDRRRSLNIGYIYFQEFIPDNDHDIRVIVIGERAFAIKRMVRNNDFRASGSGIIKYSKDEIPIVCIKKAFELNKNLQTQCTAYDFLLLESEVKLLEIGYGFSQKGYERCPGYWDNQLNWFEGKFTPEWFMMEDFMNQIKMAHRGLT
jgi:hypothetical protein